MSDDLVTRLEKAPPPVEEMQFVPTKLEPRLHLELNSTDALNRPIKLEIDIPNDVRQWGLLERAAAAKMDPTSDWFDKPLLTVINAIVFADKQGLSFEEGDVYKPKDSTRFSLTAKARIKRGLATGLVSEYHVAITDGPVQDFPWKTYRENGILKLPNYHCTVTMTVVGWTQPFVVESDLTEWFEGHNVNWRKRPKYMLEQTTAGRAFELIKPGATTSDDTPAEDRPTGVPGTSMARVNS